MTYPPCSFTDRYPVLKRIPPEERAAWIDQAERGEPLTVEQAARIGLAPSVCDVVLAPVAGNMSAAQLRAAFPGQNAALPEIVSLRLTGVA